MTKSFEAIYGDFIEIRECDFYGLDFSHLDLAGIKEIYLNNSNIGGTRLQIPSEMSIQAYRSSFDGIDLSSRTIDAHDYFFEDTYALSYCDLHNTGININLDVESVRGMNWEDALQDAMNDDWVGCYVNGKKVLSYEEKQARASEKKEEYEKMKDDIFSSTLGSIEEQVSHMKR